MVLGSVPHLKAALQQVFPGRSTCGRKVQYLTLEAAQARLARWTGWRDPALIPYTCATCGLIHLGRPVTAGGSA